MMKIQPIWSSFGCKRVGNFPSSLLYKIKYSKILRTDFGIGIAGTDLKQKNEILAFLKKCTFVLFMPRSPWNVF